MSVMEAVGILYAIVILAILFAILLLLRKLEQEFHADEGHSLRDASDRMEKMMVAAENEAAVVADDLLAAQRAVENVATDLAASHERADAVTGSPGEASDAASRSPQED